MADFFSCAYKDSTPEDTVAHIQSILASHNIQASEIWQSADIPNCYAMSVCIEGTTLRSNGKGITKALAQASGYGELMERLQMGITGSAESQKAALQPEVSTHKQMSADELWQANSGWYEALSQKFAACTGHTMSAKDILWRFADQDGMVAVREYRIPGGKTAYFPAQIIQRIYCTNGCAAGNTPEEALVQAISEIIERHHQLRVVHEDLTLPDIPDQVLKDFENAWSTICYLRDKGIRVVVKDCSLGKQFPVICVILVDEKSGRYHTHFGAFPIFKIALDRCLTEAFQGRTLENVTHFQKFSNKTPHQHNLSVIGNEVFFGSCEKTAKFFCGEPDYAYNSNTGFLGQNNKQLLRQCMDYLNSEGCDVLIQDHSALGFPTYQVLIPGISEVMIHRLHPGLDDTRYGAAAAKALRHPSTSTITDGMSLLLHLQQQDQFGSKVRNARDFSFCSRLPLKLNRNESEMWLVATLCYFHYAMGRTDDVLQGLDKLLSLPGLDHAGKLTCLQRYLKLMKAGYNNTTITHLLRQFHPADFSWLQNCLTSKTNPFDAFVLHCDLENCDHCAVKNSCCYHANQGLGKLIADNTAQLDTDTFISLMQGL